MQTIETPAIVIKTADYKEADRMLTLISPTFGKISAGARGVRKPLAKLRFAAQPLSAGDYIFSAAKGRYTLISATQTMRTDIFHTDIRRYSAGILLGAVADLLFHPGQTAKEEFALFTEALQALAAEKASADWIAAAATFRLLALSGFASSLGSCAACGAGGASYFQPDAGGMLCPACREKGKARLLSPAVYEALLGAFAPDWRNERPGAERLLVLAKEYAESCLDERISAFSYLQNL